MVVPFLAISKVTFDDATLLFKVNSGSIEFPIINGNGALNVSFVPVVRSVVSSESAPPRVTGNVMFITFPFAGALATLRVNPPELTFNVVTFRLLTNALVVTHRLFVLELDKTLRFVTLVVPETFRLFRNELVVTHRLFVSVFESVFNTAVFTYDEIKN